jgi:hypothetical protein
LTGDRDKAVAHARSGYTWYWNDGPPYSWHWELERCRKVLRELGEAEPQLPPYDPSNIIEEDFEPEIRRLLAEHAAGKPAEGKDDEGC